MCLVRSSQTLNPRPASPGYSVEATKHTTGSGVRRSRLLMRMVILDTVAFVMGYCSFRRPPRRRWRLTSVREVVGLPKVLGRGTVRPTFR